MFKILNNRWFEMTNIELELSQVKASHARKLNMKLKEQQKMLGKKRSVSTLPKDAIKNLQNKLRQDSSKYEIYSNILNQSFENLNEWEKARK